MFWEEYGTYAIGNFSNIAKYHTVNYRFIIYKKGYTGNPVSIVCGKDPAVLTYLNDDIYGIKGSEIEINLLNIDNNLPLSNFYSDYDDTFKIVYGVPYEETVIDINGAITTQTYMFSLFTGYLLQEDCSEVMTDIAHEIKLTFTDGLGLLKDIDFQTASLMSPISQGNLRIGTNNINIYRENSTQSARIVFNNPIVGGNPGPTSFIVIYDSTIGTRAYEVLDVGPTQGGITQVFVHGSTLTMPLSISQKYAIIGGTRLLNNITGRVKLSDCIRICLHATNLNLNIKYAGSTQAYDDVTSTLYTDILNNVWVDPRTFYDNGKWDSCYDVLEKICKRFNMTLFQSGTFDMSIFDNPFAPKAGANPAWHFMRFEELRYNQNIINGIVYDGYFNFIDNADISTQIDFGDFTDIEYGIQQSIDRPYNHFANSYNNNLKPFIPNFDYNVLGLKSNTTFYTSGGVDYKREDYAAYSWGNTHIINNGAPYPSRRIFVETNQSTGEIQRYLWVYGGYDSTSSPNNPSGKTVQSLPLEVFRGDKIRVTIGYKTTTDMATTIITVCTLLKVGGNSYGWQKVSDETGEDTRNYKEVTGEFIIDEDCLITFLFNQIDSSPTGATFYGPLQVEIETNINGALNSPGHLHTASISKNLRNNDDLQIDLDDTVRNYLSGTLFFSTSINNLRQRTKIWYDGQYNEKYSLGEIMTKEVMARKCKPRVKLEGTILGIVNSQKKFMYLKSGYNFLILNGVYFIIGKAEYNFREDVLECTMYEMWRDGEYRSGLGIKENPEIKYDFKYLSK